MMGGDLEAGPGVFVYMNRCALKYHQSLSMRNLTDEKREEFNMKMLRLGSHVPTLNTISTSLALLSMEPTCSSPFFLPLSNQRQNV
jgi:hypothetical protein